MTILSQLVKYLVIFHADPCNKSYILYIRDSQLNRPESVSLASLARQSCEISIEQGSLRSPNYTLHIEHAYCLSYRFLSNEVITTVNEMVEMVEILDGRLGKRTVERVR